MPPVMTALLLTLFIALGSGAVQASRPPMVQEDKADETLRNLLAAQPQSRDLAQLAVDYRKMAPPRQVVVDTEPREPPGRLHSFWIGRQNPPSHSQVEAELRHIGRHAYWYVQRDKRVSDSALQEVSSTFDSRFYPEVRRLVGSERFPGIDNDPRITIFVGDLPDVAGYVSSADTYPQSVHPYSNEREIVYVSLRAHAPGTAEFLATLAHEFTHLVHWNVAPSEDAWVKEGLAQLVAHLLVPELGLPSNALSSAPDLQLTAWPDGGPSAASIAAHYEAASWFLHYVQQRFGDGYLAALLESGPRGAAAIDRVLRRHSTPTGFAEVFVDWTIGNLLGTGLPVQTGAYREGGPTRPKPRPLSVDQVVTESVGQFGARYYELAAPSGLTVEFQGAPTVPTIGVAPPPNGRHFWHGGLSDSTIATLTRPFDLRNATQPSLDFSIWHDTEASYDFVHVALSADDGRTWDLVETARMSRTNPTGNALGPGYTGRSGSANRPEWVQERVDLTRFAGQTIHVRFIYLTDDAILREGVALNNIRIDEIGFRDNAEAVTTGWVASGWALAGASLPQMWSLQAIEYEGTDRRVTGIPVEVDGRARWVRSSPGVDRVIFVVSALTPATLQRGEFQLQVLATPGADATRQGR